MQGHGLIMSYSLFLGDFIIFGFLEFIKSSGVEVLDSPRENWYRIGQTYYKRKKLPSYIQEM